MMIKFDDLTRGAHPRLIRTEFAQIAKATLVAGIHKFEYPSRPGYEVSLHGNRCRAHPRLHVVRIRMVAIWGRQLETALVLPQLDLSKRSDSVTESSAFNLPPGIWPFAVWDGITLSSQNYSTNVQLLPRLYSLKTRIPGCDRTISVDGCSVGPASHRAILTTRHKLPAAQDPQTRVK